MRYWRESLYPNSNDYAMSHTATLFLLGADQRIVARIAHSARAGTLADAIVRAVKRAAPRRLAGGTTGLSVSVARRV